MPNLAESHPLIQTDSRIRAAYSEGAGIYRIVPAGVALPGSVRELQELVAWARESETPLIARGAGSGIPGNAVGDGIIVDLRERMPRVLEVDPVSATAVTSANITHGELNHSALPHGLRLPPDPSSSAWATLGGMTATNAAGARSIRYGPVRPWVMGMEVVTGDAEVGWLSRGEAQGPLIRQGAVSPGVPTAITRFHAKVAPAIRAHSQLIRTRYPEVRKNTAGYALDQWLASGDDLDLLIGAEGTLGLVTTIRWRLHPIAKSRAGLRVALRSLDDLEQAVRAIVALDPSAVELLDRTFLDLVGQRDLGPNQPVVPDDTDAMLLVEFERDAAQQCRGAVGDAVRAVRELASDVATALTREEEQRLWALRHAASPILAGLPANRRSLQVIEDGCVPLPRLGEYVRAIRAAARAEDVTVVIFGHAGDGNVHVNALVDVREPGWLARVRRLYDAVNGAALRLGGTVSGEHGDGRLRPPLLEALYGAEIVDLFRRLKTAFDPDGIFNPGVKLPVGSSELAQLKVGPDAASIPEDIAAALREIEQTGGYARSRLDIAGSG
ncbi:MAG TPA: FAD-binding oxidoreductase [Gemmatimonadales bacterium]|nr:FAD-binding oxidoreductase [Gemmatimonadales bacterium]